MGVLAHSNSWLRNTKIGLIKLPTFWRLLNSSAAGCGKSDTKKLIVTSESTSWRSLEAENRNKDEYRETGIPNRCLLLYLTVCLLKENYGSIHNPYVSHDLTAGQ